MKRCPVCNETKHRDLWSKSSNRGDGLHWCCKACKQAKDRARQTRNVQRIKNKRRYEKEKDKFLIRDKTRRIYDGRFFMCAVVDCDSQGIELHHVDYTDAKAVIPLCKKHHAQNHNVIK